MTFLAGVSSAHGQTKQEESAAAQKGAASAPAPDAAAARASEFATSHGALGSYYDAAKNQHVIVVSSGSRVTAADVSRAVSANSRVERRTITKATADAVQERIAQRSFHASAGEYNYASYLDLTTGKVVLTTDAPASVTAGLSAQLPGVIDKRSGAVRDDSRQADTPPFWGGASIRSGGGVCSAAFPVQRGTTRYMLTAGHCFPLGATVQANGNGLFFGTVVQRGPIPPFDMELIGGASYGTRIFTGGVDSTTSSPVVAAGDPVVGFNNYCRSGQTTGEQCGQTATSVDAQVCTQTGCKSPVIAYTGPLSAGGDSGAPFYVYGGSSVHMRGMHIASGGSTMYAEKWSRISSNLNVAIVTG